MQFGVEVESIQDAEEEPQIVQQAGTGAKAQGAQQTTERTQTDDSRGGLPGLTQTSFLTAQEAVRKAQLAPTSVVNKTKHSITGSGASQGQRSNEELPSFAAPTGFAGRMPGYTSFGGHGGEFTSYGPYCY